LEGPCSAEQRNPPSYSIAILTIEFFYSNKCKEEIATSLRSSQ
jgi:hypothetical protein